MPFLSGGISAVQFTVDGPPPDGGAAVERLATFAAGWQTVASADGVEVGWLAGEHELDTAFAHEKNVRAGFVCWELRVSVDRLPAGKMRAYTAIELRALAASNPTGRPSARQKREARETARDRLEEEAKDGRYRRHTVVPVVWDRDRKRVWFGSASVNAVDRFVSLFQQTFGVGLDLIGPARLATRLTGTPVAEPTEFVPGGTPDEYAWDSLNTAFVGNEFVLWLLWHQTGKGEDDIDGVVVMNARTLTLDCPRGQTGSETIRHDSPIRLPEVKRALQSGKLPRSVGLTVVADGEQYELTLQADQWSVSGGKVPKPGEDAPADNAERDLYRLESVRAMFDATERLYRSFLAVRQSAGWDGEVAGIRAWLGFTI